MITVLCATKGDRKPEGLNHLCPLDAGSWEYREDQSRPWAAAANNLLDGCGTDALFLDDDVELTPSTFDCFARYRDKADIIGFTLFHPTPQGLALQSAGFQLLPVADSDKFMLKPPLNVSELLVPRYCAHVTASCMYVSQKAIESGLRFPVWPGQHHEDVAFTYEAWLKGLKVAYVPGMVLHHMGADQSAGATKRNDPKFEADRAVNWAALMKWESDNDVHGKVRAGIIPAGFKAI